MNEDQNPTSTQDAESTYQGEYTAAWETAVEALSTAVRLNHPVHGPVDFADFLAAALAAVAANVGSTYRVTAGRSGSWEADLVQRLLTGTVGEDEEYLFEHRTEPVVVPLNVQRLVGETAWVNGETSLDYDQEREEVVDRHEALPDDEFDPEAMDAELSAVETRWVTRHTAYAQAFTAAVTAEAARMGLRVPVTVEAFTHPDDVNEGAEHPDGYSAEDGDQLVYRLWDTARQAVPLPSTNDTTGQA